MATIVAAAILCCGTGRAAFVGRACPRDRRCNHICDGKTPRALRAAAFDLILEALRLSRSLSAPPTGRPADRLRASPHRAIATTDSLPARSASAPIRA